MVRESGELYSSETTLRLPYLPLNINGSNTKPTETLLFLQARPLSDRQRYVDVAYHAIIDR